MFLIPNKAVTAEEARISERRTKSIEYTKEAFERMVKCKISADGFMPAGLN